MVILHKEIILTGKNPTFRLLKTYLLFLLLIFSSCSKKDQISVPEYFRLINLGEKMISSKSYHKATEIYNKAFSGVKKPFGKDVFNAALASAISKDTVNRNFFLQQIINNSSDLDYTRKVFVPKYMSDTEWQKLEDKQSIEYSPGLREKMNQIYLKDQLFRPDYDNHDDTINRIRESNLRHILKIKEEVGFPSHIELGYRNNFRGQKFHYVLHHTSQRRSKDKGVKDLEPLLKEVVHQGRLDPEQAILYLSYQNDLEKRGFQVYSIWQYRHDLLPQEFSKKLYVPKLSPEEIRFANEIRADWYATPIEDIHIKAKFLYENQDLPFIFTSVRKSISIFRENLNKKEVLEQYKLHTLYMVEYN